MIYISGLEQNRISQFCWWQYCKWAARTIENIPALKIELNPLLNGSN